MGLRPLLGSTTAGGRVRRSRPGALQGAGVSQPETEVRRGTAIFLAEAAQRRTRLAAHARHYEGDKMTKWEYKILVEDVVNLERLNEFGAEGWELVGFQGNRAYFIRSIEDSSCDDPICCDGDCLCQT